MTCCVLCWLGLIENRTFFSPKKTHPHQTHPTKPPHQIAIPHLVRISPQILMQPFDLQPLSRKKGAMSRCADNEILLITITAFNVPAVVSRGRVELAMRRLGCSSCHHSPANPCSDHSPDSDHRAQEGA